jgi:hypothetical protein
VWLRRWSQARKNEETDVNRAYAIADKAPALNVHRLGMLGLNVGLWTLIIVIGRVLCA